MRNLTFGLVKQKSYENTGQVCIIIGYKWIMYPLQSPLSYSNRVQGKTQSSVLMRSPSCTNLLLTLATLKSSNALSYILCSLIQCTTMQCLINTINFKIRLNKNSFAIFSRTKLFFFILVHIEMDKILIRWLCELSKYSAECLIKRIILQK